MPKKALFIGNGEILDHKIIANKLDNNYDYIVALDGGIRYCKELNIKPDFVIGDIDSAIKSELFGLNIIKKQSQNLTDFEFATDYCLDNFNVTKVDAIAVTSLSRIDHSLLNIHQIIHRLKNRIDITILTENSKIKGFFEGNNKILCRPEQTISLIILTKTLINSTKDLRWNLTDFIADEPWVGVSNIAEKNMFYIDIKYGYVIVIFIDKA